MSLLTQFYPGPGGGGDSVGLATGSPTIILGGVTAAPTPTGGSLVGNTTFYYPTGANNYFQTLLGGTYSLLTANNVLVGNLVVPASIEVIRLNGSAISLLQDGSSSLSITSISGSGVINSINFATGSPSLTSISTSIEFAAGGGADVKIQGAALDAPTVNHILESFSNSGTLSGGLGTRAINLSGGTSAGTSALTAAGTAAVAALTGAGWTVTLNP